METKDRKLDHINLALNSQTGKFEQDRRFIYEPMLAGHPTENDKPFSFLGKTMKAPLWISSMTGGTGVARDINSNIARACREFGLGMGLGSCRKILFGKQHWEDFDFRDVIGDEQPFWANLGIAQVEELLKDKNEQAIVDLVGELRADGLIIHVNPMQEWFQPEGDHLENPPVETIETLMSRIETPLIVKEVGHGMGEESLKRLLQMKLEAIEFAAFGGANFSKLELMRAEPDKLEMFRPFTFVGQSAGQMVKSVNRIVETSEVSCRQIIVSGGIKNYLDGYFYVSKSKLPAIFGMASQVLKHATGDYEILKTFIENQITAYRFAQNYLKIDPEYDGE
jgi:isopentenyl-diphosphate delta-isomerase